MSNIIFLVLVVVTVQFHQYDNISAEDNDIMVEMRFFVPQTNEKLLQLDPTGASASENLRDDIIKKVQESLRSGGDDVTIIDLFPFHSRRTSMSAWDKGSSSWRRCSACFQEANTMWSSLLSF